MQRWDLPSFDDTHSTGASTLPTVEEIQNIQAKANQEGFARGLQEGLAEGRAQGFELGKQEGVEQGHSEGFQTGYQQGYQSGSSDLERHLEGLSKVLQTLSDLPDEIEFVLTEWVYETALRLTGQSVLDREVFVSAVQEALMRLPRPSETLLIRFSPDDASMWARLADQSQPFHTALQPDPKLAAGEAYVDIAGTHLDVGAEARRALVKSALGLLEASDENSQ